MSTPSAPPTRLPDLARPPDELQRLGDEDLAHGDAAVRARGRQRIVRALGMALMCIVVAALAVFSWLWHTTPSTTGLAAWVHAQDARYHAVYTPLSAVSPSMTHALVAIEDERFYQHHGIDTLGLLRAAWDDARAGRIVEGGSTLTAQLAKNAYLGGHDRTLWLKAEDLVLALKVEQHYSKSQILEMYLNLVYYGEGAHGIAAAAKRYFATTPARLDIAQSALLAGLVRAPGYYDPWCHPNLARTRQHEVLARMLADGYISASQARAAANETFTFWLPGAALPADAYCPA